MCTSSPKRSRGIYRSIYAEVYQTWISKIHNFEVHLIKTILKELFYFKLQSYLKSKQFLISISVSNQWSKSCYVLFVQYSWCKDSLVSAELPTRSWGVWATLYNTYLLKNEQPDILSDSDSCTCNLEHLLSLPKPCQGTSLQCHPGFEGAGRVHVHRLSRSWSQLLTPQLPPRVGIWIQFLLAFLYKKLVMQILALQFCQANCLHGL